MWREGRRYEQQLIEPATVEHMAGQIKMSLVDGIKGAAEQANGTLWQKAGHASGAGFP